ncbi:MAG: hypothetical protein ABIK12_15105 [Pseudomonadota bacterium]
MSEAVQVKEGRQSSEYQLTRSILVVGALLVLAPLAMLGFGKVNAGDPGWADYLGLLKWVIGIGAALCLGVGGWYTTKRTDLKKLVTGGLALLLALGLALAAVPALAGTIDGATPEVATVTSTPEPAKTTSATSTVANATSEAWNKIKSLLGLKTDGQALSAEQTQALVDAIAKLSQQNVQLKTQADAAAAQQQVFGLSGGANQVDALIAALSQRVNQTRVLQGIANQAYGTPFAAYGVQAGSTGQTMTTADIRQAVKDELKANETWFDTMPWWARAGLTVGFLAIFQDLGIALPGIN